MTFGQFVINVLQPGHKNCGLTFTNFYGIMKSDKLGRDLQDVANKTKKLSEKLKSISDPVFFDAEEQELMRRLCKSLLPQMKDGHDRNLARSIINKTGWLE